ncbi:MAG: sigma-70 family RNA polymerase sigma factor [Bacteroidales bacterium]
MPDLQALIQGCIERDPQRMEQFYHRFAPSMWVVCLRYTRNTMLAEDVMQEGFIRAFDQMANYTGKGSLEGWLRRIFITSAINHFKKHYRLDKQDRALEKVAYLEDRSGSDIIGQLSMGELLEMLNRLPDGYRVVFNLYAIEGYNHREIAEMLGFSEGNSKSQLARARAMLQRMLVKLEALESLATGKTMKP